MIFVIIGDGAPPLSRVLRLCELTNKLFYRAATIVLRENNCHFLRVDKDNFNRILRDVEANTVRLKEHGKDVLILEKISTQQKQSFSHFKYCWVDLKVFGGFI